MVSNPERPDFLTIEEIAALLRVQVSAVRARLGRNDPTLPPSRRIGGRRLFPTALYQDWRENLLRADAFSSTNEVTSSALVECHVVGQRSIKDEVGEMPGRSLGNAGSGSVATPDRDAADATQEKEGLKRNG